MSQFDTLRNQAIARLDPTLGAAAQCVDTKKYTKHKRGPKKPPRKKISGKRHPHVSTARILAMRA